MRLTDLFALLVLFCSSGVVADEHAANAPRPVVTPLSTRKLPDYPGKEAVMLAVEYPPGAVETAHRHEANAFVYVLEGSVVLGVAGSEPVTLTPGQTFYEGPNDVHTIGRNESKTRPARFVVFLLKDVGKPAVLPVK